MELFREEALRQGSDRDFGSASIILPAQRRYTIFASGFFALALIALCIFGTYSRRIHVNGRLVPSSGLSSVTARSGGTITQVLVIEGSHVKAGAALAILSNDRTSKSMGGSEAIATRQLHSDSERLRSDMASEAAMSREQTDSLQEQLGGYRRQDAHLVQSMELQRQQISLQQKMLDRIQPLLSKGYVSSLQIQEQQQTLYSEKLALEDLARQREDLAGRVETTATELRNAPRRLQARLSDIASRLSTITQALAQAETERSETLTAPVEGRIATVLARPGQPLKAGQTAITIVPDQSTLVAEFLVNGSAIGLTKPGAAVALHFDAFPYEKYGSAKGRVLSLPTSALSPEDVMSLLGQPQVDQVPVYRLDVELPSQTVLAQGVAHPLLPGMTLDADLILEKRRLVEWIFEPLMATGRM